MNFLPIVQRELRVAARRRITFVVRFGAAVVTTFIGGVFLIGTLLPGSAGVGSGRGLFGSLSVLAFVGCLLAGVLGTADCLSRERREGTLGLLFLTDLRGYDVVAGKLMALALPPAQGLLAVLPVTALTLFMGGVTGAEVGRVLLVLVNTLFLSLSIGLWVSSQVSDERRAVGIAVVAIVLLTAVPELLTRGTAHLPVPPWVRHLDLGGPWGTLQRAFDDRFPAGRSGFWWSTGYLHVLGWFLLASASWTIRHGWREDSDKARTVLRGARPRPTVKRSTKREARLEAEGPMAWYGWRHSWARRGAWWIVVIVGLSAGLAFLQLALAGRRFEAGPVAGNLVGGGFYLLKILVAVHAIYLLQDACRSGLMELLLVTPIASRRMCDGHVAAIRAWVVWPFVVLALMQLAAGVGGKMVAGGDWPSRATMVLFGAFPAVLAAAVHGLDLVAVTYHASRWALHYDRPTKALARTLLLVVALPALVCSYGRLVVDLLVIGRYRPMVEKFRDLCRGWYFPDLRGPGHGVPRVE